MSARKRVRDYLAYAARQFPEVPTIARFPGTKISLTVPDLQTLLHSEREARHAARTQSGKAADAVQKYRAAQTQAVRRGVFADELRAENTTLRKTVSELSRKIQDPPGSHERWQSLRTSLARAEEQIRTQAETIEQLNAAKVAAEKQNRILQSSYDHAAAAHKKAEVALAAVPALRKLSEDWDRDLRALTAERDREREHATRLAKKLDTLRAAPGTVNYQELYNELLPKAKRAERDLYNEQQRSARLQEALDSAAREAAPRTYADILREALAKETVDDLLRFLRSGK